MRWKTDWLYQLIFQDVERIWQRAVKDGESPRGPSPDYFVVRQFANMQARPYSEENPKSLSSGMCGPILKRWKFDAEGAHVTVEPEEHSRRQPVIRGMFYQVGSINFYLSPDRKLVAMTYIVGPRYGEHRVFRVAGQGRTGGLEPHPDFMWWIS